MRDTAPTRSSGETHDFGIDKLDRYTTLEIPQLVSADNRVTQIETDANRSVCQDGTVLDYRATVDAAISFDVTEAGNQSIGSNFGSTPDVGRGNDARAPMYFTALIDPDSGPDLSAAGSRLAASAKNVGGKAAQIPGLKQTIYILADEIFWRTILSDVFQGSLEFGTLQLRAIDHP
ncbi:MAG: hypothetical protein WAU50_23040 [Candidatus Sulfotelmatobacter sp.]